MIISRTPFRMSFFGGGTDYPAYYEKHKGAVLATTINKYCYISCRYLPPFFDHKSRIIYSKMEHANHIDEIDHPCVRETLRFMNMHDGLEIHHDGDLPARTGLGSSSSFAVGLLNVLYALKGQMVSKERLAREAIHVEQVMCEENVGCQDQMCAAHGGLNVIQFGGQDHLEVTELTIPKERRDRLQEHMMLFFTGFTRKASDIAEEQVKNTSRKSSELSEMYDMVWRARDILNGDDVSQFGMLLNETWKLKRTLSEKISNPYIDDIYETALKAGALGGKLLGAGGGGFMLFFVPPEHQDHVREKLNKLIHVPFQFESMGSRIIFYQPESLIHSTEQAKIRGLRHYANQ